jgi:two-component system cell cycle response regulator
MRELPVAMPSSRPTPSAESKFVLVVMSGPQIGDRRPVDPELRIGRDPASDLALRDATVSWSHARAVVYGSVLRLEDLGSRHGCFVGGRRVSGSVELVGGEDIEIGKTKLKVELHGPAELLFDRAVLARLERDDVTGLLTRRKFDAEVEGKLEAAAKAGEPLSLLVLDLDGLKRVNDAHGHLSGGEVIRVVGEMLRGRLGEASGCRFGGDEFAIAVWPADESRGATLADELIRGVAETEVAWGAVHVSVTASCGVAVAAPTEKITVTELFARADRALFAAKRSGGNQVARWSRLPVEKP